jgi:hypothetical protein
MSPTTIPPVSAIPPLFTPEPNRMLTQESATYNGIEALGEPAYIERSSIGSSSLIPVVLFMAGIGVIAAALFVAHRRRSKSQDVNGLVTPPCSHSEIIVTKPGALTPTLMRARVQETIL